jgi:cysteine desulfurase/selenocysteine lyase
MTLPRIYLDNAATSWPKPESVYRAVERCLREVGAAAGRGAYTEAMEAGRIVESARTAVSRLIGAANSRQIAFTSNGTDSLNLVLHGWLQPGDHVVTTAAEHNSVLRPLAEVQVRRQVETTIVPCDKQGFVDPEDVRRAIRQRTALVVLTHASNVTGALQPVREIADVAHERGAAVLLDAAQTLGHMPVDVNLLGIDFLAAPGHKGLLGPLGTGVVYIRETHHERLNNHRQGGTGTRSDEQRHPETLPEKFEAGNLNVPALAGLGAGVEFLQVRGLVAIRIAEAQLLDRLIQQLQANDRVQIFGPEHSGDRAGVVSVALAGYDPQEAATLLDASFRVQARAGLHCAPLIHKAIGTFEQGGTVRFSVGPLTTEAEIDAAVAAVREITADAVV